ncbi:hypothetical protein D3C76_393500 [compost metagenome]
MADHRDIADVLLEAVEVEPQHAEQRVVAVDPTQLLLPVGDADHREFAACLAEGRHVVVPAQGLGVVQVEYRLFRLITTGVEGDESGEKVHWHQVEIQGELRYLAKLDRALEHQHQAILVRLTHAREAVEADVAGTVEIDPHTKLPCPFEDSLADPFGQVVAVLDVDRWCECGRQLKHSAIGGYRAGGRERRDEVEDFFAASFAQAQTFENRLDVVPGERLVIEDVIDVGRVVHQSAKLLIQPLVNLGRQTEFRPCDVCRVNPHPAHIQMLQTVLP